MKPSPRVVAFPFVLLVVLIGGTLAGQHAGSQAPGLTHAVLSKLPIYFVENRGVYPDEVRYWVAGADKTLFFTPDGITFRLRGAPRGWVVKLEFVGARSDVVPRGEDRQEAVFSYFRGPREDWKAGLPTCARLVYPDLWPGIDLVYTGTFNELKYAFVIEPGADPARIRLRYRGADGVAVTDAGSLRVETPAGGFEDASPVAFQETAGGRREIALAFVLDRKTDEFGFEVGDYDRTKPLVLDPAILVYCGYIGGSLIDAPAPVNCAVAVDAAGAAYVVGATQSNEQTFPVAVGPDLTHNGNTDAFVAKVNATGTGLIYCGYIGGTSSELGYGVAVDAAGNAYVTGMTQSTEQTFPVAVGPDLTHNGGNDAFAAKVNTAGTGLLYCGYIGGSSSESGRGIAVDAAGNAYVAGETQSTEQTFPVAVGPDLTHNGGNDAYVACVNAAGTGLVYCGYVGGSSSDVGYGIAVDAAGSAYVAGQTQSTEQTFPVAVGPALTYAGGTGDAFVVKVNPQGAGLAYAGFIGGSGAEVSRGVAVDANGAAYVFGQTSSNEQTFPVAVGPVLTLSGGVDAFVAKVHPRGTALNYCGYVGGASSDYGYGIAVDPAGNVYVTGQTSSNEQTFPVAVGPDVTYNGGSYDAFVAKVSLTVLEGGGAPRPGGQVDLTLTASSDVGLPYQVGSSLGTGPIPIGTRVLNLSVDDLLLMSVSGVLPQVFANYAGWIGTNGQAQAHLLIPNIPPLVGLRIHSAFVTLSAAAPFGMQSISNTFSFTITK